MVGVRGAAGGRGEHLHSIAEEKDWLVSVHRTERIERLEELAILNLKVTHHCNATVMPP
jgi:hypothetical protein